MLIWSSQAAQASPDGAPAEGADTVRVHLCLLQNLTNLIKGVFCTIMLFLRLQVNAQTRTLGGSVSKNLWHTEKHAIQIWSVCVPACLYWKAQGLNKQDITRPTGRNADAAQVRPCRVFWLWNFIEQVLFFYLTLLTDGSRFPVVPNCKSLLQLPELHLLIPLQQLPLSQWVLHFQEHNRLILFILMCIIASNSHSEETVSRWIY